MNQSKISNEFFYEEKNHYLNNIIYLKSRQFMNNSLFIKEKNDILNMISNEVGKNISFITKIFLDINCRFGNCISFLNKFLFYCEIIGCKSIILNDNIFWFIKNKIILKKYNMTIQSGNKTNYNDSLIYKARSLFFAFFHLKPEIRIHLLKDEILKNLPKIQTNVNDLFIHIISGDIFNMILFTYSQPPLCFYEKIINNFKFRNIHILTEDKSNPVVKRLLNKYNYIIYKENTIKIDISLLINAFNIVASTSSFVFSIIQLKNNLRFLWDYSNNKIAQKKRFYHYDLYKYPLRNFSIFLNGTFSNL